jgi:hypothetical protein
VILLKIAQSHSIGGGAPQAHDVSPEVPRRRESSVLVTSARKILRYAQDDSPGACHPERSEGSLADFWGITSWEAACRGAGTML